ncbi:GNAT superfamily N-acetyltransferase [Oxalobacteraceae bacterium GrIS 1.11]
MTDNITIRPALQSDFTAWSVLWDGYNAFYGRAGATALPAEITHMTWSRFFDDEEPVHALVAQRDGVLLGLVHYIFHRSTTQLGPTCYLQDLFTAEAARGKGVGRLLIETVYGRAREAGAKRVYWQTRDSNTTAMALYDKLAQRSGFIVYHSLL